MAWTSVVFPVPSSPDSPMTAGAWSWRPRSSPNRLSSLAERRIDGGLELQELIAQHRCQLEIERFGGGLHRSEERRVGKECRSRCRPDQAQKNKSKFEVQVA